MGKWLLGITGLFLTVLVVGITGCQKPNDAIDNNQVVETPYTLYFGDTSGAVYNTNDGVKIKRVPFPADGLGYRAIATSKSVLLFVKSDTNLYSNSGQTILRFSSDNGITYNDSWDSLRSHPATAVNGFPLELFQNMIQDIPKWNRVYVVTTSNNPFNWLGIAYSFQNGIWGSWTCEAAYTGSRVGILPATITSLTFTSGNVLYGLDAIHQRTFYRTDTFTTTTFNETTGGLGWNSSGVRLPTTGFFSLGHYNNELIAIDNYGFNGAYFSDDSGMNWAQFSGIPANIPLLCISSPFEETCLIGTAGSGLYIMNANSHAFQPCNNGLSANLIVRSIAAKENVFKNGNLQKLVYLASNKGIYVSKDDGHNWTLVMPGNFTAIY